MLRRHSKAVAVHKIQHPTLSICIHVYPCHIGLPVQHVQQQATFSALHGDGHVAVQLLARSGEPKTRRPSAARKKQVNPTLD